MEKIEETQDDLWKEIFQIWYDPQLRFNEVGKTLKEKFTVIRNGQSEPVATSEG